MSPSQTSDSTQTGPHLPEKTISSTELCERTGATYRQIDHWCNHGIFPAIEETHPGSGYNRRFAADIVDRVSLLVKFSTFSRGGIKMSEMKKIYDKYEDGCISIGQGVIITWRVNRGTTCDS